MYFFLLFLLFLAIPFIFSFRKGIEESFTPKSCHKSFKKTCCPTLDLKKYKSCPFDFREECRYCKHDKNVPCLHCKFQRVGLTRRSEKNCCKNICPNIGVLTGQKREDLYKKQLKNSGLTPYWCRNIYRCVKKFPTARGFRWCGQNDLNNQPEPIFPSKKACFRNIYPYIHLSRRQCLNTSGVGWCTDYNGDGLCVPGGPDRPSDLVRYGYCFPNRTTGVNSYIPGMADPFVRQYLGDKVN